MAEEMKVLSREHFFDLLDGGQEEFRISATTPGKNKRVIQEDAPFDKDDPMSYVLVDLIFDKITINAKGKFSAHDIAEAQRVYGQPNTERAVVRAFKGELNDEQTASLLNFIRELRTATATTASAA